MSTDVLTQRYGAPSAWRRRAVLALAASVVLLFGGWLVWTVLDQTTPQVTSDLETFTIDGQHSATAVVIVQLAGPDVEATCKLRAFAEDHTVVGEAPFTPDPAAGLRQVAEVRTERQATSVELLGCTAPGQNRPR